MHPSETGRMATDVDVLHEWMDRHQLGRGPIEGLAPLAGGTQNILLRFTRDGNEYVLRRAPAHTGSRGNKTMRREATILQALAQTDVPHPSLIATCDDPAVLGSEFYLMESVRGFNITVEMPPAQAGSPSKRRQMGLSYVDAIATLGQVDYVEVGLDGFGKPEGYLDRQVDRWQSQLEAYRQYQRWDGLQDLGGLAAIGTWLESSRPEPQVPGIVHGDYQLSNVLFDEETSEIAAILDWELSTIGDPLLDLGQVLATWPDARGDRPGSPRRIVPWEGFPTPQELVSRYALSATRDLSSIDWYAVLACFRTAIILEGSYARASAGLTSDSIGRRLHHAAIKLVTRAESGLKNL
jgi:aminoglycoside phosphotransferase (APT) family kinase protein